jgi:hypothetical protein
LIKPCHSISASCFDRAVLECCEGAADLKELAYGSLWYFSQRSGIQLLEGRPCAHPPKWIDSSNVRRLRGSKNGTLYTWDFFLAHAAADKEVAESLYDLLCPPFRVFLDSRCLLPGDDWDRELAQAQSRAAMTLVLVSSRAEKAYYQREEIAAAIDMARRDKDRHRVVPIYAKSPQELGDDLPYGLRLKHGLLITEAGGLSEVAQKLRAAFQMRLAMPAAEIQKRYENRVPVQHALPYVCC